MPRSRQVLPVGWGAGYSGGEEASSAGWRLGIYAKAFLVDDDVVVEPAQQHEPIWVVVAAVGLVDDVVGFEAVAGGAAVCLAAAVAVEHVVADTARESVTVGRHNFETVCVDEGGPGFTDAEDLAKGVGPDFDSGTGGGSGFSLGALTFGGVYEDVGRETPRCRHVRLGWRGLV